MIDIPRPLNHFGLCIPADDLSAIELLVLTDDECDVWKAKLSTKQRQNLELQGFFAANNSYCVLDGKKGAESPFIIMRYSGSIVEVASKLSSDLPKGIYSLKANLDSQKLTEFTIAWAMESYNFKRSRARLGAENILIIPKGADIDFITPYLTSLFFVRDLINLSAEELNTEELGQFVQNLATYHEAQYEEFVGAELLENDFGLVHAVGRASAHPPRLCHLSWGIPTHPCIALVGKGVCFDTGGLHLKPRSGMLLMKKDMGGAAIALGLAHMIISLRLPLRLELYIPIVENAIGPEALRSLDVVKSKAGKTVEIRNTDAEGRLILADALTYANEVRPDFVIDFATLTGAARQAFGFEVQTFFTQNNDVAKFLIEAGDKTGDNVWQMPLHHAYRKALDTPFADISNFAEQDTAGAITAALFLMEFVENKSNWLHLDVSGYNRQRRPARPEGGEATGMRTVFNFVQHWAKAQQQSRSDANG